MEAIAILQLHWSLLDFVKKRLSESVFPVDYRSSLEDAFVSQIRLKTLVLYKTICPTECLRGN